MTFLRRSIVVTFLAVATALASTALPAQAAFNDTATSSATVGTVTVAAPTALTVETPGCTARWVDVTVSWSASTTAKVTGYLVTAHRSDGIVQTIAQTDAATTRLRNTADKFDLMGYSTTFTVTTKTSYGWTKESVKSGAITC